MYRNLTGTSSMLAILAMLTGAPSPSLADGHSKLCNVLLDRDGEPIGSSDFDQISHDNTDECDDDDEDEEDEEEEEEAEVKDEDEGEEEQEVAVVEPVTSFQPLNVYFDVGEQGLDVAGRADIEAYVVAVMATAPQALNIIGYTDSSGSADANAKLSLERAGSVANAMIDAGVPADIIDQGGAGVSELPDDSLNRRVTVTPGY